MQKIVSGIFRHKQKGGRLIDPGSGREVAEVPSALIEQYALTDGAAVEGRGDASPQRVQITVIDSINRLAPEVFRQRPRFQDLTAIDPHERFPLGETDLLDMRLVDLLAPIGRGTRGLIVAPPQAGKTTLLEHLAQGLRQVAPETRIIVLLIDERPEEVTYFRRTAQAEVFASSSDRPLGEHIALTELLLAHIRIELECGHDVVVLVDSLTRLVRAANRQRGRGGRTLSGGLEASALALPRRFFGLARNIEHGGSVTLVATLLIDTGSRMDQVIFEEFKGTGNSEILLDRELAQARLFPAIDVRASSTRKEHLLHPPEVVTKLTKLRRALVARSPQRALSQLLALLEQYPTNAALLDGITP
jgi:transcription termination factor Rho